jgi:F-type H+-transporting ATPase subunit delta
MESIIVKKYAKALLEIEGISLEEILNQLSLLSSIIESDKEVQEFLTSPLIRNEKKYEALVAPIADKLDKRVVALLKLMAEKGRLHLIPELTRLLEKEIMIKSNKFNGIVESNEDIDKPLIKKLEKKLSEYSKAKIKLNTIKTDLDGIKVEVNDLGLELNFSKQSVKNALLEHIRKAL